MSGGVVVTEIPQAAIDAAYAARYGEPTDTYTWDFVTIAVLEAALPHIAAAERERIRQLAEQYGATYDPCDCPECQKDWKPLPFADLLTDPAATHPDSQTDPALD